MPLKLFWKLAGQLALLCLLLCGDTRLQAHAAATISALSMPLVLPSAIVFDTDGSLFFAERGAHSVRRIDMAGNLTTVAGNGVQGFSGDGASSLSASLDSPQGLALGPNHILYIADTHNRRVRSVDLSTHVITTIAGDGFDAFSGDGGPAVRARLSQPTALAVAPDGSLYIADSGNHRIRRVSLGGVISTVAGSTQGFSGDGQSAADATLDAPEGIAVDLSGNVYIADSHNHRVREIAASGGFIQTIAGGGGSGFSGDDAAAVSSKLTLPKGVSISPTGEIYIADSANQRIRKIGADGVIRTVAGNGIQGFSGDGGIATAGNLNSPSTSMLDAAGNLAFADTGNGRIREVMSDANLTTLSAPSAVAAALLTLSGASSLSYGSGTLTATLRSSDFATGAVTLLSLGTSGTTILGTVSLSHDSASFDTSALNAGTYNLVASYGGDNTHAAAQSAVLVLTISPAQISATPTSIALLYGQSVPVITGRLSGVLAQDQGEVSVHFFSSAGNLSPAGSYPISAVLTGSAAPNYTVTTGQANVLIQKAPALASLTYSGSTADAGSPLTLASRVNSTTTGLPTGYVSYYDESSLLATVPVSATGDVSFTTTGLSLGIHSLLAQYSGDTNFLPSMSNAIALTIGSATGVVIGSDFSLASTSASTQTVVAGGQASYSFAIQGQGPALTGPVTLSVLGLPMGCISSLNPAVLPPGGPTAFVLSVTAPRTVVSWWNSVRGSANPMMLGLFTLPFCLGGFTLRTRTLSTLASLAVVLMAGCGDRVFNHGQSSTASQTYTLTVNATAATSTGTPAMHSTNVTLIVQ